MQSFLQFALGFFDAGSAAKQAAPRRNTIRRKGSVTSHDGRSAQVQPALDFFENPATEPGTRPYGPPASPAVAPGSFPLKQVAVPEAQYPALPLQSLQQALEPGSFSHPKASRYLLLGDILVGYAFARGRRRTIGFSVGPDGLAVRAPKWVALHEVDKAVLEKAGWIVKKLHEARQLQKRLESARISWKDGACMPLMGHTVRLVLEPAHNFIGAGAQLFSCVQGALRPIGITALNDDQPGSELQLHVGLAHAALPEQIRDVVQAWLMREARSLFKQRLDHFAPVLKVQWRKLSLSSAGTRWGSASADGSIRLNWRLMHYRLPVIDYVVVHELSHLRVMDHSPQFWDTVRAVMPNYPELRQELKADGMNKG